MVQVVVQKTEPPILPPQRFALGGGDEPTLCGVCLQGIPPGDRVQELACRHIRHERCRGDICQRCPYQLASRSSIFDLSEPQRQRINRSCGQIFTGMMVVGLTASLWWLFQLRSTGS